MKSVTTIPIMMQRGLRLLLAIITIVLLFLSQFFIMPMSKQDVVVDDVNSPTALLLQHHFFLSTLHFSHRARLPPFDIGQSNSSMKRNGLTNSSESEKIATSFFAAECVLHRICFDINHLFDHNNVNPFTRC